MDTWVWLLFREDENPFPTFYSEAWPLLKTLHSEKHILTKEEFRRARKAGVWWLDELARAVAVKPPRAVKLTLDVLNEYNEEVWCSKATNDIKVLSKLYQQRLVTEDDLKAMKREGYLPVDLPNQLIPLQYTKPPKMVARTADVLETFGYNEEARKLRVLNELFPRHLLTAEECSEVVKKGWWEWVDHLAQVLFTKAAEVVQEAIQVLEEHGYHVMKKLKRYGGSMLPTTLEHESSSSVISTSSLAQRYMKMRMHPHDEESSLSSEEGTECPIHQGSKDMTQPAGGGSDFAKEPDTAAVTAVETLLDDLCWIPLGVQSQSVGPEGGKLCLQPSADALGEEEGGTILLEVPSGAVIPSQSVEVRSAVIPHGPFTLPEGYQLGSMVVYINYSGQCVTQPLNLRLPHWYGGEDHIQDGLSFAVATHTLKEGECMYRFELLEGGARFNRCCGELQINGHCSLFAEVFKKGAISRYQAISLQKQEEDEITCDVAVTYAFSLWCNILTKYRSGWTVGKPSCSFTFREDRLKGKLKTKSGNGWQAVIKGSSVLEPDGVDYDSHGITSSKLLKMAVLDRAYPPAVTFAITYREGLRNTGRPVWVHLELLGAGKELTFVCKAYEEMDHLQLDGRNNAAAAAAPQSRLSPPPDLPPPDLPPRDPDMLSHIYPTAPPHAETDSSRSTTSTADGGDDDVLSQRVYNRPDHLILFRIHVARKAAGKARAVLEGLLLDLPTITACFNSNSNNEEKVVQDGLIKWIEGEGQQPPTWKLLLDAMMHAEIAQQHVEELKDKLGA